MYHSHIFPYEKFESKPFKNFDFCEFSIPGNSSFNLRIMDICFRYRSYTKRKHSNF